jgi:hypothetical protein
VLRHNISNDAAAFKEYPAAIEKLQKEGTNSLPYIFINDKLVTSGYYPSKSEWDTSIKRYMNSLPDNLATATADAEKPSSGTCCSGSGCC